MISSSWDVKKKVLKKQVSLISDYCTLSWRIAKGFGLCSGTTDGSYLCWFITEGLNYMSWNLWQRTAERWKKMHKYRWELWSREDYCWGLKTVLKNCWVLKELTTHSWSVKPALEVYWRWRLCWRRVPELSWALRAALECSSRLMIFKQSTRSTDWWNRPAHQKGLIYLRGSKKSHR